MSVDSKIQVGPVPADVLAWWRRKGLKPTFSYEETWKEEHSVAFSVAKVMRRDVLAAMQQELARAIEQGVPFEKWAKQVEPRFREMGWWAPHPVMDPETGHIVQVDPPSRLRRIFQTNMRQAHSAGQYDRIQRNKRWRPYVLYLHGNSEHPRPEHLAWHGLILPADDPWWSEHWPINGWGCKCSVQALSKREADTLEAEGVQDPLAPPELDDDGLPTGHRVDRRVAVRREAPPVIRVPHLNKRSGTIEMIPQGVDPGFNYLPNEGRQRALAEAAG